MTKEQFVAEFVALFPHHKIDYDEHIKDYAKILGHIFWGNVINRPLASLLETNTDKVSIQKYIGFVEHMYALGDDDVKNIVLVTILEYLGDNNVVLKNAFQYFSDDLIEESKQIEEALGRRKNVVSHKKGPAPVGKGSRNKSDKFQFVGKLFLIFKIISVCSVPKCLFCADFRVCPYEHSHPNSFYWN